MEIMGDPTSGEQVRTVPKGTAAGRASTEGMASTAGTTSVEAPPVNPDLVNTAPADPAPKDPGAVELTTRVGGALLPNPVLAASGCAGTGRELAQFVEIAELGALVTPSVTLRARAGAAAPRIAETPSGMLHAIGLQNPGIDALLAADLPWLAQSGARVVVSIAGTAVEDYVELARRLHDTPALSMIELNLGCPNRRRRGQHFFADPDTAGTLVAGVRGVTDPAVAVTAKLSAEVSDIVAIARACVQAGADGVAVINAPLGLVIDPRTLRPALSELIGAVSGPAIRPVALRCVWQIHDALPLVPIVGMGGIMTGDDALQFILAGATAVAVGSAALHDPGAPAAVLAQLRTALAEHGFSRVGDAVGFAHRRGGEWN